MAVRRSGIGQRLEHRDPHAGSSPTSSARSHASQRHEPRGSLRHRRRIARSPPGSMHSVEPRRPALLRAPRGPAHRRPRCGTPSCPSSRPASASASTSRWPTSAPPVRRRRGLPRPQLRQEEPRAHREGAGDVRRRVRGHRLRARTLGTQCSTSSSSSPTTPSPSRTLRLRLHRLPDRLPQGELPGRVLRRAAHQREGQPRQGRDLPGRVPHDGHRGAGARRQPVGLRLHARRRGRRRRRHRAAVDRVRALRGAQRRLGPRRAAASPSARPTAPSSTSTTSSSGSTSRCSTRRRSSR